MKDKKIAPSSHELYLENQTKKAKKHFNSVLSLNIVLAVISIFSPGNLLIGAITTIVSVLLSLSLMFGIKYTNVIWSILCVIQLFYYFFNLSVYFDKAYPMLWFIFICARSLFCFYCLWAFILNYDIQDLIRERQKKLYNSKK